MCRIPLLTIHSSRRFYQIVDGDILRLLLVFKTSKVRAVLAQPLASTFGLYPLRFFNPKKR